MMEESRRLPRTELHKPVSPMLRWRGRTGEHDACIKDVTLEGCFLNTLGAAELDEIISFNAALATDELIELRGRVVHHHQRPVGFGLKFEDLTDKEQAYLNRLIADAGADSRQNTKNL